MINKSNQKHLGLLAIYPLFFAPVIFFGIWAVLGKPIYTWDAVWYRNIADSGYSFDGDITREQNIAFLPGYPVLIKLVMLISGFDSTISQQIACLLGYLVGGWFFFKVLCLRLGKNQATGVMFIWSIMPFSLYFINGYSESIILALAGITFYLLIKERIVAACFVISYGLITRPHALVLLPLFFYYLFRIEQNINNFTFQRALVRAGFRSVELAPFILIFPAILTVYWFLNFGDSLVYKNGLYAWTKHVQGAVSFDWFIQTFSSFFDATQYSKYDIYNLTFLTLTPRQVASFVVLAGTISTVAICSKKYFDFFLFNAGITLMWMFTSDIGNVGRHSALVFSFPMIIVVFLQTLKKFIATPTDSGIKKIYYMLAVLFFFISIVLIFGFVIYYMWFIVLFFNNTWVS